MRTFVLSLLLLSSCALLDSFVQTREVQAVDEHGAPLFVTADGALTTAPMNEQGTPNRPRMVQQVEPRPLGLEAFGPWGALAGAIATIAAGAYARQCNRRLQETDRALCHTVRVIEQIKNGELNEGDGRVSQAAIKQHVRNAGAHFAHAAVLAEAVRRATRGEGQ